jgi:hypothetical protein
MWWRPDVKITNGPTRGSVVRNARIKDGPVIHRAARGTSPAYQVKIEEVAVRYESILDDLGRLTWTAQDEVIGSGRVVALDGTVTDKGWAGPLESAPWITKIARWLTPGPFPVRSDAALYVRVDGESP